MIPIAINGWILQAELAYARQQRQRGLMARTNLGPNGALLMCYPYPQLPMVWMKDTPLPLSCAFIDERKRIIQVLDLVPFDLTIRQAEDWCHYAIEVHRGWFTARGIGPGSVCHFELPPNVVPT